MEEHHRVVEAQRGEINTKKQMVNVFVRKLSSGGATGFAARGFVVLFLYCVKFNLQVRGGVDTFTSNRLNQTLNLKPQTLIYRSVEALTLSQLGASRWQTLEPDVVRKIRQRKSKITKRVRQLSSLSQFG